MPFDPNKPFDKQTELSEAQKADIQIDRVRFEEYEATLTSILEAIEAIEGTEALKGGEPEGRNRILELLKLGEIQLNMIKRESIVHSFKEEAGKAWRALMRAIHINEEGKASLIIPSLEQMIQELGESRTGMINGLGRLGDTIYLSPKEVVKSLKRASTLADIHDQEIPPFNRNCEADVYRATTVGGGTDLGLQAVESTLERARTKVGYISEDVLTRAIVYYQMVLSSLLRVYNMSQDTKENAILLMEGFEHGGDDESMAAVYEHFNYELRIDHIIGLIAELVQRIEFTLKMLEQETGVDHILTQMVPGPQLAKLKRKIQTQMPDGEDKTSAIRVIEQALHRRQTIKNVELPVALQRKLITINLLGLDHQEEDVGEEDPIE